MADETGISWTDHTFNPWWGCSRVAPGCDNCYAAALDKRTGGAHWDNLSIKPRLTKDANWRKPLKWNKDAAAIGQRRRVFCGSMMDWTDKNAPEGALDRLWELIRKTPWLDWQLLTKRATLIKKRLPVDWGFGYENVWLGVTCENIQHGIPRVHALQEIPAIVRFVSAEPLLEEITSNNFVGFTDKSKPYGIDWIIIGGESGPDCRPMKREWVHRLLMWTNWNEVPVWFKQWGGNSKDKGGCNYGGSEIKEWPVTCLPITPQQELL
jgi:protein gp37|tara:strand:- start:1591 stop:2388 length:798 start_codon:yes stop_codon:yes gene_type:complete